MSIAPTHAIADTGATSIFVMAGTQANNICNATHPIHISLLMERKLSQHTYVTSKFLAYPLH
jgi:hypothetical protein